MKFLSLIYIKDTKLHILQNRNNISHKLPQIPGKCAAPLAEAVITSTLLFFAFFAYSIICSGDQ